MIPGSICALMMANSAAASSSLADTDIDVISGYGACTSVLTIRTDGLFARTYTGTGASFSVSSGPSNWYTPSTGAIGSSYQVRFTPSLGFIGVNTGTLVDDTWTTISADKTIVVASNNSLVGTIEFRVLTGSVFFTSGALFMSAAYEP